MVARIGRIRASARLSGTIGWSPLRGEGFCEAEGIGKSTFWRWRRRLADGDAGGGGRAMFVELAAGPSSPWDVELELGAGVVLRVRRPRVLIPAAGRRIWLCVAPALLALLEGVDMEVKGRRRRYRRTA